MSSQSLTIPQVAKSLGVSPRTVRRYIKSGKIKAGLVPGPFGDEYRIPELPAYLYKSKSSDSTPSQSPVQTLVQIPDQTMDIIRELQEKNLALAAQLGAATERIRNLEKEIRLLNVAKQQPWWKRLFAKRT